MPQPGGRGMEEPGRGPLIYKGLWMGLQSRWVGSCGAGCGVGKARPKLRLVRVSDYQSWREAGAPSTLAWSSPFTGEEAEAQRRKGAATQGPKGGPGQEPRLLGCPARTCSHLLAHWISWGCYKTSDSQ